MVSVKKSSAAGLFYPSDPERLRDWLRALLVSAQPAPLDVRAIIAPHAGYKYSGPVAAAAYAHLRMSRRPIRRVALLGPAHFFPFLGLATTEAEAFSTPLGKVPVDPEGRAAVLSLPQVDIVEEAFEGEHSIEVHLPFLQEVLEEFSIIPLLAGKTKPEDVAGVIEALWDETTLVVASSDLSHNLPSDRARRLDEETARAVEAMQYGQITPDRACGHLAVGGLLRAARRRGFQARLVDLRNSSEAEGSTRFVVGYGAFIVF